MTMYIVDGYCISGLIVLKLLAKTHKETIDDKTAK